MTRENRDLILERFSSHLNDTVASKIRREIQRR